MTLATTTIGELNPGGPLQSSDLFVIERIGGNNFKVTADEVSTFVGGGGGGHEIEDNGSPLAQRAALNFIGFTVADNPGADSTDITAIGGGSPLTTKGDLFTFDTVDQRLAVGTDGQFLVANSAEATGLEWVDIPTQYVNQKGVQDRFLEFFGTDFFLSFDFDELRFTENDVNLQQIQAQDSVLTDFTMRNFSNDWDTDVLFKLRINGADSGLEINIPAGQTGNFFATGTTTINISQGDLVNWQFSFSGGTMGEMSGLQVVWATELSAIGGGGGGSSPLTTAGDLYGFDTADQRIPIGSPGQVLTVVTANPTQIGWTTPAGGSSPTTTQGDLIARGLAADLRVPIGTNGQLLSVNLGEGPEEIVEWIDPPTDHVTSIIASNTVSKATNVIDLTFPSINFDGSVIDLELVCSFGLDSVQTIRVKINNLSTASYTTTSVFVSDTGTVTGLNVANSTSGFQSQQTMAGGGFGSALRMRFNMGDDVTPDARPTMEFWETCGGPSGNLYRAGRGIFVAEPAPSFITSFQIDCGGGNFEVGSTFYVIQRKVV